MTAVEQYEDLCDALYLLQSLLDDGRTAGGAFNPLLMVLRWKAAWGCWMGMGVSLVRAQ